MRGGSIEEVHAFFPTRSRAQMLATASPFDTRAYHPVTAIGRRLHRLGDVRLLKGRRRYAGDVRLPGLRT